MLMIDSYLLVLSSELWSLPQSLIASAGNGASVAGAGLCALELRFRSPRPMEGGIKSP
jgi:hypothetical protein